MCLIDYLSVSNYNKMIKQTCHMRLIIVDDDENKFNRKIH